jgi:transcriptional regulator with XRE-family HTH domain
MTTCTIQAPGAAGAGGDAINGDKIIDLTFARRLNQIMVERNLYPADIQRLTGIRRSRVYEYTQGVVQPSMYNLKRLAEGLNVSVDWLIGVKKRPKNGTKNTVD